MLKLTSPGKFVTFWSHIKIECFLQNVDIIFDEDSIAKVEFKRL